MPPIEGGTEKKEASEYSTPIVEKRTGLRGFVETRVGRATVGAAGLLTLGGLVFGGVKVAESANVPESHEPVATAPANTDPSTEPSTEASPSATPSASPETSTEAFDYNYNLTEANVASLMSQDVYSLNQLPTEEKAKIPMFYAQTLPDFAESWQAVSKNPLDVLPKAINENNTPAEINAFVTMQARQAMTLTKPDGFHFDKQAADTYIASQLINGTLSKSYEPLTDFATQLDGPDSAPSARSLPASDYLQMPVVNSSSDKYKDAAGHLCIDMNTTQQLMGGAAPVTSDITVCLVTNENGSIWMPR